MKRYYGVGLRVATFAMAASLTSTAAGQDERPGFRGVAGTGVAAATIDADALELTVVWRMPVGSGYSGISVVGGVAVTMAESDETQFLLGLDSATGDELWRRAVGPTHPGREGSWTGPISTPVVHGNFVVGLGAWGNLVALDLRDGEPVWSVNLVDDFGAERPFYGFATSPLVVDGTLVVQAGGEAGSVLGLDLATGVERWRVGTELVEYQVPVVLTLAGARTVVAAADETIFGIDPASGEVIWEYAHEGGGIMGESSLVPVGAGDGRIFITHTSEESKMLGVNEGSTGTGVEQIWLDRTLRRSYSPSVYHDGYLYGYNSRIFTCVNASTGERVWRSRAPGDGFISVVGDTLVILTKEGTLHLARASADGYQELANAPIFDKLVWTAPSYAEGDLFVRSLDEVVRVDLHGGGSAPAAKMSNVAPRSIDPGDGAFGRLVRSIEASDAPVELVDAFFADAPSLPLVEGDDLVHFVYRGDAEAPAIAGDFIGMRQEAPMVRIGETDMFYFSTRIHPESRVGYVFVPDTEPMLDPHNPLQTRTTILNDVFNWSRDGSGIPLSDLRMPGWTLPPHLRGPDPGLARGSVETLTFETTAMGEATYRVYLPAGYADSNERYPVVYYHGSTPEEFSAVALSLDNLIADGMAPVMAVFTPTPPGGGAPYIAMWADELIPAVDAKYRTIAESRGRVGVGGGRGGMIAIVAAFVRPEMTSGLGLHTPIILEDALDMIEQQFLRPASERPLRVYIDWGIYDLHSPHEQMDFRDITPALRDLFLAQGFDVAGGAAPDSHDWVSWRNRADVMLRAILPTDR